MRVLFDTHTFIWWTTEPARLSASVRSICADMTNLLLLSVASVWEIEIKRQIGKLDLRLPLHDVITKERTTNGLMLLPIEYEHAPAVGNLPLHHKDPFDRLLIAQAIVEDLTLLSVDDVFSQYDVRLIE